MAVLQQASLPFIRERGEGLSHGPLAVITGGSNGQGDPCACILQGKAHPQATFSLQADEFFEGAENARDREEVKGEAPRDFGRGLRVGPDGFLALAYSAVAFAVGAVWGKRSVATASAATLAIAGYVIEGLAAQVKVPQPIRAASPWHWLLDGDPLRRGLVLESWLLPLAVSLVLIGFSTAVFARRDLR